MALNNKKGCKALHPTQLTFSGFLTPVISQKNIFYKFSTLYKI